MSATKLVLNNDFTIYFHDYSELINDALGANREIIEFKSYTEELNNHSLDEIDIELSNEENLSRILLIDEEDGTTYPRNDYVLNLGISSISILEDKPSNPPTVRKEYTLRLGKRTYLENQLKALGLPVASTETMQ